MKRLMRSLVPLCLVAPAVAQTPPDYGYHWATIGDAGNAAFPGDEVGHLAGRGSVGYQYRMATTETTNSDWIQFCRAYAPFYQGDPTSLLFHGAGIYGWHGPNGYEFEIGEGLEHVPTGIAWRMAARYCNWLTNGRVNEAWAFERGAYDTSTFTQNPDGSYNDQRVPSPGALFWIPTTDEWMKAGYYDPNRFGTGQGGWWDHPYASSGPLLIGPPGQGQTNASLGGPGPVPGDAGLYPEMNAPWGLLDISGGEREMTSDWNLFGSSLSSMDILVPHEDKLGWIESIWFPEYIADNGLRLASAVPEPGTGICVLMGLVLATRRRR